MARGAREPRRPHRPRARGSVQLDEGVGRWWTYAGRRINHTLKYGLEVIQGWKVQADKFRAQNRRRGRHPREYPRRRDVARGAHVLGIGGRARLYWRSCRGTDCRSSKIACRSDSRSKSSSATWWALQGLSRGCVTRPVADSRVSYPRLRPATIKCHRRPATDPFDGRRAPPSSRDGPIRRSSRVIVVSRWWHSTVVESHRRPVMDPFDGRREPPSCRDGPIRRPSRVIVVSCWRHSTGKRSAVSAPFSALPMESATCVP